MRQSGGREDKLDTIAKVVAAIEFRKRSASLNNFLSISVTSVRREAEVRTSHKLAAGGGTEMGCIRVAMVDTLIDQIEKDRV